MRKPNASQRTCNATNKRGEPCAARAVTQDGLCAMHGGLSDPRAMGQAGGRGRTRAVLGIDDKVADDRLRLQAKAALEKALNSDNEAVRLRAAQSLYSYRSLAPPAEPRRDGESSAGKPVSLAALIELATETQGVLDGARMQDAVLAAAERVRELQVSGRRVEPRDLTRAHDVPPSPRISRDVSSGGPSPLATNSPEPAPSPPAPPKSPAPTELDGVEFDESTGARLKRRYGSEVEGSTWRWA